jgi:hypothetical protein
LRSRRPRRAPLRCPFTPLAGVNTTFHEREPELTDDTLTLCCISDHPPGMGGYDLVVATRDTTLDANEGIPLPSADGLTIFL